MKKVAFVGDIHGSLDALEGMLEALAYQEVAHTVFLGDYINKGMDSRLVLARLIPMMHAKTVTLLRGNHETELLNAIEKRDLTVFLKMGGAATVRSYLQKNVGSDVLDEFSRAIPGDHLEAIREMPRRYSSFRVIAQHAPIRSRTVTRLGRFAITAHRPVGARPRIRSLSAEIDTGCSDDGGRLTGFLWPQREYIQVDGSGNLLS